MKYIIIKKDNYFRIFIDFVVNRTDQKYFNYDKDNMAET